MKTGVVVFPGSNCDEDIVYVLRDILKKNVVKLWHKDTDLKGCDLIILPGGFSFGDYLRSGSLAKLSPVMEKVIEFAENGGIVFGICNGFQILCESGLLPGALLHNTNHRFICTNTFIIPEHTDSLLTSGLEKTQALKIPIAHGQGNYYADEESLIKMNSNKQILFRYCNKNGDVTSETNVNGSSENIAGISNQRKNVFGMMPHPERACDEELKNTDGRRILKSLYSLITA